MECDILDPTSLLHAVEAFVKSPYPVCFAGFFEAGRLFNKNCFYLGENPIKKGSFDVEMLYISVIDGSYMHKGIEGLEASNRSCCFVVINEILLSKSLGDITDFISGDVASIVLLSLANQLPFKGSLSA